MKVEIVTPDQSIYNGEAELVRVPGVQGSFEILNNHAPIISALGKGSVSLVASTDDKAEFSYEIESGIVEVKNNKVNVLIEK